MKIKTVIRKSDAFHAPTWAIDVYLDGYSTHPFTTAFQDTREEARIHANKIRKAGQDFIRAIVLDFIDYAMPLSL